MDPPHHVVDARTQAPLPGVLVRAEAEASQEAPEPVEAQTDARGVTDLVLVERVARPGSAGSAREPTPVSGCAPDGSGRRTPHGAEGRDCGRQGPRATGLAGFMTTEGTLGLSRRIQMLSMLVAAAAAGVGCKSKDDRSDLRVFVADSLYLPFKAATEQVRS